MASPPAQQQQRSDRHQNRCRVVCIIGMGTVGCAQCEEGGTHQRDLLEEAHGALQAAAQGAAHADEAQIPTRTRHRPSGSRQGQAKTAQQHS